MKRFVIVCSMLLSATSFAAGVNFSDSADLSSSTGQHKLVDAEYKMIPTRTETHWIPGCNPHGETSQDCTETVVLESAPAIAVNISYVDSMFSSNDNEVSWLTLLMDPSEFPAADVAALKENSPAWQHPLSNEGRRFAKNNITMSVDKVERDIQILDMKNSKICPVIGEAGETMPGCVEKLVYKTAKTKVKAVSISAK